MIAGVDYRRSLLGQLLQQVESGRDELLAYLKGERILLIQKFEALGSRKLLILDGLITRNFMCHQHQVVQRLKEVRTFEVVLKFLLLN